MLNMPYSIQGHIILSFNKFDSTMLNYEHSALMILRAHGAEKF